MLRDFTYIDDVTEGIIAAINRISSFVLYNLGNNRPEKLTDFIKALENALGRKAEKVYLGIQAGDIPATMADIDTTRRDLGWEPKTSIDDGLKLFADWFKNYNDLI
jgi:UDP-glucuronate 4-epimerase